MKKLLNVYLLSCLIAANYSFSTHINEIDSPHILTDRPVKLRVLHAALEAKNAKVGGVGAVVGDLIDKQNQFILHDQQVMDSYVVTPFYGFLRNDTTRQVESLGTFEHFFQGKMITSQVYYNAPFKQFFLEPAVLDLSFLDAVRSSKEIYEEKFMDLRLKYWNSAVAGFAHYASYNKEIGTFNILNTHSWCSGLAISLVEKKYNPQRLQESLPPIKTVATNHNNSYDQGFRPPYFYDEIGLDHPEGDHINFAAAMNIDSAISLCVSRAVGQEMLKKETGYGLHSIFRGKQEKNRFISVANGIDHASFDPQNINVVGKFASNSSYTNISQQKNQLKNELFENNIIGHPTRPLMVFVGRFCEEKGTNYLPHIAHTWCQLGGQMVIMGLLTEDHHAASIILRLQAENNPLIKVYTDLHQDQLAPLSTEVQARKGNLIRYAADWVTLPSLNEAGPIVPMEGLSYGAGIFTSWVQGLKDTCKPLDCPSPFTQEPYNQENFNSISYCLNEANFEGTAFDIQHNLKKAYDLCQDVDKWAHYQSRWAQEAKKFDWMTKKGSIKDYYKIYRYALTL